MTNENLPISEQYRIVAKKYVDAEAAANILEESKSAYLSQLMLEHGDIAVSKAELLVKGSPPWWDYIEKMVEARKQANLLKVQLKYIEMKYFEGQSYNATKRAEMRL